MRCALALCYLFFVFFFKQKTAYEMRISDWSSDVCSSDLELKICLAPGAMRCGTRRGGYEVDGSIFAMEGISERRDPGLGHRAHGVKRDRPGGTRSEERRVGQEGVSTCRSRWSP